MSEHVTHHGGARVPSNLARSFAVRHRRAILVVAALLVPVAGIFGGNVARSLSVGGFVAADSEYERGRQVLTDELRGGTPNIVLLVEARHAAPPAGGVATGGQGAVDDDAMRKAGIALTEELRRQPGVLDAGSYWTLGAPLPLRSRDGRSALVLALAGGDEDQVRRVAERLSPLFSRTDDLVRVRVGGAAEVSRQVGVQAERDLRKAELIVAPFTLIALVIVFRGLVAALLPLAVALVSVLSTFATLRLLNQVTPVSVFALNLTTALGLGLAIDYSLFLLTRYREERARGHEVDLALRRTMRTAGRTVLFSAVTVAVSLAALALFPMAYLRSYAYAGIAVVGFAALASVTVLPALVAVLGPRVGTARPAPLGALGFWGRQAQRVMRRPVTIALAVTAALVLVGGPVLHLRFGLIDDRVIPHRLSSRAVNDVIRTDFTTREADAIAVVVQGLPGDDTSATEIGRIADRIAAIANVNRVDALTGHYLGGLSEGPDLTTERFRGSSSTWLSIVPATEAISAQSESIVRAVRHLDLGHPTLVTGPTARLVDTKDAVNARLPIALAAIAVATFVVLFAMLGSIVVPLKALVLNVLSLSATFGAMVWVFQDGHFTSVLGVTPTGAIDVFTPILMFCVAFGLSMDYEIFLLSRIKEEFDLSGDNAHAVVVGLDHTGRLVTAAALLLAIVFLAFMTSAVSIVKLVGLGLTLAVLIDAFLIRATVVPALMRLAGRVNWRAPEPLRRLHLRFGIWEHEPSTELDRLRAATTKGDTQ